jgi:hypothetical protein
LKSISSDHSPGNLTGDGNKRNTVKHGISESTDEVSSTGTGGSDANTGEAGGTSITLCGENSTLFVTWKDVTDGF